MIKKNKQHYDDNYFDWQSSIGEFGGWANRPKFSDYISPSDTVLDFGCGGGYLLKGLLCQRRIGVEVNPTAAEIAKQNGIEIYQQIGGIPTESIHTVISNHALEHTTHTLNELKALYQRLKVGGKIIVVVPCESISYRYQPNHINYHLYSWSPMCLGNLFTEAGFSLIESKPYMHKWPPKYQLIAKLGGRSLFDLSCYVYAHMERSWFQVRAIGEKTDESRL